MTQIIKYKKGWLLTSLLIPIILFVLNSCEEYPDDFKLTDGIPEVHYIRVPEPSSSDSLLVKAFMDHSIVLVGKNLTSIMEMWFNDQKAILNTSLITDKHLFVSVPGEIPSVVT